ncbi:carboxypeptidase-like regulatory domain-containing protein, partial [Porphyromonas sp.]|uniref:carboxypeptidase-like regulatory domain-containing protein n=1 Tax=Porphyromonas sp. TaxID=1924944 RepID=UPI00257AB0F7
MGTQLRNLIVSLMLLIGSVTVVCAQTILVQGKVLDSRGTPLPKVSVTVKLDNSTHTTTDKEGKFSLQVPEKSVLVFTLTGKKTTEAPATTTPIEITLEDGEEQQKGSTVTTMRQTTSIQTKYYPLWVIDGVVYKQDSTFNTADLASTDAKRLIAAALPGLSERDIESFTVITDASATALYGNQATGGVISVRTRHAGQGINRFTYTSQLTYRFIPSYREFNILNSQDQMSVLKELEGGGSLSPETVLYQTRYGVYGLMYDNAIKYKNKEYLQDNTLEGRTRYLQEAEMRNTDWFKELFQHSIRHQHTVSLASGGQVSNFYASLGATIDPGWAKVQSENTYFFNLNATFKPHKYWTFGTIVNASYTRDHDGGDFTPLSVAQTLSRTMDPTQYYLYEFAPYNIKEEMNQNYRDVDAVNVRLQASIAYRPSTKFNASLLGSIQYYNDLTEFIRTEKSNASERFRAMNKRLIRDRNSYLYKPADDVYAVPRVVMPHGGYRTIQEYASRRFDLQARATYTDTFAEGKHALTLVGGTDLYDYLERNGWHNEYGVNFEIGQLSTFDPMLFHWLHDRRNNYYSRSTTIYRNVSFLGNLSYSYLGRYTLDGSFRYEGTNRFGKSRLVRWIPTWNVALGWDVSSESFFPSLSPLSSLSTRLSYGMTGTLPSVYNSYQRIKGYLPFRPGDLSSPSLYISEPANHDLTYEKMYELNWNLNFGLLKDRIGVSLSLFSRQGRDLVDISYNQGTGGFFKPYGNVASMEAKGVELSLTTQNVKTQNFSWTTSFSYARNTNKVTKLLSQSDVSTLVSSSSGAAREGYPLASVFSIPFYKLSSEGFPLFYNSKGQIERDHINFSATEDLDYLKYSGTLTPTDQGGLNNSFRIGNFTLSAYILYSFGSIKRLPTEFSTTYYDYEVLGHEFNRRWKAPGDEEHTNVPSIPTADQR